MGRALRCALAGTAILGLALFAVPPAAAEDTVTRDYAASNLRLLGQPVAEHQFCIRSLVELVLPESNPPDLGGACFSDAFPTPPVHDRLDLTINDVVADDVVARYTISDIDFNVLASGFFCDRVEGVEMTSEAWHLDVAIFADPLDDGTCAASTVPPSLGTITADFYTVP